MEKPRRGNFQNGLDEEIGKFFIQSNDILECIKTQDLIIIDRIDF